MIFRFIFLLFFIGFIQIMCYAQTIDYLITPGVHYTQYQDFSKQRPLLINSLCVNLAHPNISVKTAICQDVIVTDQYSQGRESIGRLCQRRGAFAGVNGDFFMSNGDPLGLMVRDGELVSESMPNRVAMGISPAGTIYFGKIQTKGLLKLSGETFLPISGINRFPTTEGIVLLTPTFGKLKVLPKSLFIVVLKQVEFPVQLGKIYQGEVQYLGAAEGYSSLFNRDVVITAKGGDAVNLAHRIQVGDKIQFRFDAVCLDSLSASALLESVSNWYASEELQPWVTGNTESILDTPVNWNSMGQAISGGPWLVRKGQKFIDGQEEGFREAGFVHRRHPRTAVGVTSSGELLMVCVDGRGDLSSGMSLSELADYMLLLGAYNAINLDGGGSTEMCIKGLYVNSPSDIPPSTVSNALLVFDRLYKPISFQKLPLRSISLYTNRQTPLFPPGVDKYAKSPPLWGSLDGNGFVNQMGVASVGYVYGGSFVVLGLDKSYRIRYKTQRKR